MIGMTPEKMMERATMSLLLTEPFYGTILMQMPRVAVGKDVCEMMAVDGKSLFYNPEGIATLTFDVIRTLLMHEAGHIAYLHHIRMGGRDPEISNIAGDHVINLILKQGAYTPWEGWLCDERFEGQTFEQVYGTLAQEKQQGSGGGGQQPPPQQGGKQQQQQQGQQPGQQPCPPGGQGQPGKAATTPGGMGQIMPCPKEEAVAQETEWKMIVETAAAAAAAAGQLPGHLARMVEELREAKVDWRALLRAFISNQIPTDFTWSRPSRRTLSQGIYLPSQVKEGLGELVFAIDMSGSCTRYVPDFSSEVGSVHQDLKPSKLTILSFDTRVHDCGEFDANDDIEFNLKGGGGTDFRPIFDTIERADAPPKAVVILTDLLGPFPKDEPNYPVLWISTRKGIAPFGETVRIEL